MLEVITPADSMDLTTVEAVRNEFDIAGDSDDDLIASWIATASDVIARYCKRTFPAQTYRETFHNNHWRRELLLAQYPVAGLIEVIENGVTLANDTSVADAEVDPDVGFVLRLANDFPAYWAVGKIIISYDAGFSTASGYPTMPPAIERAAIMLVGAFRNRSTTNPAIGGIRSVQHGDVAISYALPLGNGGDLPPEVTALLQPYRDARVR